MVFWLYYTQPCWLLLPQEWLQCTYSLLRCKWRFYQTLVVLIFRAIDETSNPKHCIFLSKKDHVLKKNKQLFPTDQCQDWENTASLNDEESNYYQSQVGILSWIAKLGHLGIYIYIALISSYSVQPGYWSYLYYLCYLKHHFTGMWWWIIFLEKYRFPSSWLARYSPRCSRSCSHGMPM